MGGSSSSSRTREYARVPPTRAPPSSSATSEVRVVCPRCRAILVPPASIFRCPCGQLMTYEDRGGGLGTGARSAPAPPPSVVSGGRGGMYPGGGMMMMSSAGAYRGGGRPGGVRGGPGDVPVMTPGAVLLRRIHHLLSVLEPTDPNAMWLRTMLERLPRNPDGSIREDAFETLAAMRSGPEGATASLIDILPTRVYKKPKGDTSALDESRKSCMVCLEDFEDGETLRTLPCLDAFHKACIDPWLETNKTCPLCKTAIDAALPDELRVDDLLGEVEGGEGPEEGEEGGGGGGGGGSSA